MIKSMTGFGRGRFETEGKEINIEIKSVNHKYHDINIKMPRSISYLEDYIKKRINEVITRGKVDVFINYANFLSTNKNVTIDDNLAESYFKKINEVSSKLGIRNDITIVDIVKLPDVVTIVDNQDEEEMKNNLDVALNEALKYFLSMRNTEGEKIAEDLNKRLNTISIIIDEISNLSTGLIDEYVVKLKDRLKEIMKDNTIDENRIAMEAVIYADKTSIEEEITRLKSHIIQFKSILLEEKPVGKKLDFLIQEMNRETNTIASKANCLEITKQIVEMKNEIENIREQIQNVE